MDEYHQHDNSEHGFTRVHEFAERSDAHGADGEEPRPDGDQGHVGTFDAKAEELGKNADAPGADGEEPGKDRDQGRVGTFEVNAEALGRKIQALDDIGRVVSAGFYIYAWQRQVVDFYGMRLRKNVEFGRRLAEADGIADLIGLQREYVRGTLLDYASSFRSLYGFGLHGPQQTTERLNR
jgi:hypothetical protein